MTNVKVIRYNSRKYDDEFDDGYYGDQSTIWDDIDYYNRGGTSSASQWWRGRFRPSYSQVSYNENESLNLELREIARTVNAVRNSSGALNREKNLKVAWSNTKIEGTRESSKNNWANNAIVYLSPDPLHPNSTIKPSWSKDQKRDALIGEALTLTAMKRTVQPQHVKNLSSTKKNSFADALIENGGKIDNLKTEVIARELWKSLEVYKAQSTLLKEYRGCRVYFTAYNAFYSSPEYKKTLEDSLEELPERVKENKPVSIICGSILSWNANHFHTNSEQLVPNDASDDEKYLNVLDALVDAYDTLMDSLNQKSTMSHWSAAVNAAAILVNLDPDDDENGDTPRREESIQSQVEELNQLMREPENGNSDKLFGSEVENRNNFLGSEDVEEKEINLQKSYSDSSKGTLFFEIKKKHLLTAEGLKDIAYHKFVPYADRQNEDTTDHHLTVPIHRLREFSGVAFRERGIYQWGDLEPDPKILEDYDQFADWALKFHRKENKKALSSLKELLEPVAVKNELPEYGRRSGRITGTALWKVPTPLPDRDKVFYRKHIQGETRDVSVSLLVDFSGSMDGGSIIAARQVTLLLHDLFEDFPNVDLDIYFHGTGGSVNFIGRFETIRDLYNISTFGGTNEGSALARTAYEIKFARPELKKKRKILFSIGDGFSNQNLIESSVRTIRKSGIEVYNILIDGSYDDAALCYGKGNISVVQSDNRQTSLRDQILTSLRPWLVKIFSKIHTMSI